MEGSRQVVLLARPIYSRSCSSSAKDWQIADDWLTWFRSVVKPHAKTLSIFVSLSSFSLSSWMFFIFLRPGRSMHLILTTDWRNNRQFISHRSCLVPAAQVSDWLTANHVFVNKMSTFRCDWCLFVNANNLFLPIHFSCWFVCSHHLFEAYNVCFFCASSSIQFNFSLILRTA